MVVKTRRNRMSLRRSYRTRPSNQTPVIYVEHSDIKLFEDSFLSFNCDSVRESPLLRRHHGNRKAQEVAKVFQTDNAACPTIPEVDSDHSELEKLNAEFDMAEDFSLIIENLDGVRMKRVGNKLVKYDSYQQGNVKDDIVSTPKVHKATTPDIAERERERRSLRRAHWMSIRKMLGAQRNSGPVTSAGREIGGKERLRSLNLVPTPVQPIQEASETESTETNLISSVNRHYTSNVHVGTVVAPPLTPVISKDRLASLLEAEHADVTPKRSANSLGATISFRSNRLMSFSPLTAVENVEELSSTALPISRCLPQAQSTPLSEEDLQKLVAMTVQTSSGDNQITDFLNTGDENVFNKQSMVMLTKGCEGDSFEGAADCRRTLSERLPSSFGSSPRWDNVTMRTKSRLMHMRSRELDEIERAMDSTTEGCESAVSGVLECNESCAVEEEEELLQCTNVDNFIERNVTTNMTISNTYRSVSHLRNDSFIDIPYYLNNYPHFRDSTPLLQLLFVIEQNEVMDWRDLPKDVFDTPRKLGEGVYGEVYETKCNGQPTALKVIPFCGNDACYKEKVNGEYLLDAAGILPEILINRELSALSDLSEDFSTPNFIQLLKVNVVKGQYPEELLVAWDEYDDSNESENDRPSDYASDQQLFVTIGMAMGGVDLEHYKLANEDQVLSVLFQIAVSLVVAEERLEFEHRDLHIGNVLVEENGDNLNYRYSRGDMVLRSYGVKVHLIDFTLSRMSKEGTTVFRDLEDDEELFTGKGDYQFDIYRMMRNANQGDWLSFTPKTNCFWLHYLAVKLISQRQCKKAIPKKRRRELQKRWDHLLEFDSLKELFTHDDFLVDLQQHLLIKHPPPCQ
ncbi:hypothetical protein KIN20_035165 [Parelaphostrongylus tenuis]|uniref:non-specific serine/threonine protein kinase n=1 Tax=Parelaphostrongylus tenuis TaxID=148309 RepID=A0AAD5WK96_PARTN|nr:hypothetical protein KIN20_035165 [Parelaphostrongylus tenuis]